MKGYTTCRWGLENKLEKLRFCTVSLRCHSQTPSFVQVAQQEQRDNNIMSIEVTIWSLAGATAQILLVVPGRLTGREESSGCFQHWMRRGGRRG